jgi:hypothetical protein
LQRAAYVYVCHSVLRQHVVYCPNLILNAGDERAAVSATDPELGPGSQQPHLPDADLALQFFGVDDRDSTDSHSQVVEIRAASGPAAVM